MILLSQSRRRAAISAGLSLCSYKDQTFCEWCKTIFTDNHEWNRPKGNAIWTAQSEPLPFGCVSRMRELRSCCMCVLILERLEEPSTCECTTRAHSCVSIQQISTHEHDREWRLFFRGILKGSVVRNGRPKWKASRKEAVCMHLCRHSRLLIDRTFRE